MFVATLSKLFRNHCRDPHNGVPSRLSHRKAIANPACHHVSILLVTDRVILVKHLIGVGQCLCCIASLIYAGTALLGKRHLHPSLYAQIGQDASCRVDMGLQLLSKKPFAQILFSFFFLEIQGTEAGPNNATVSAVASLF